MTYNLTDMIFDDNFYLDSRAWIALQTNRVRVM